MALQSYLKIGEQVISMIILLPLTGLFPLHLISLTPNLLLAWCFRHLGQVSHFLTVACLFHCLFPVDDDDNGTGWIVQSSEPAISGLKWLILDPFCLSGRYGCLASWPVCRYSQNLINTQFAPGRMMMSRFDREATTVVWRNTRNTRNRGCWVTTSKGKKWIVINCFVSYYTDVPSLRSAATGLLSCLYFWTLVKK